MPKGLAAKESGQKHFKPRIKAKDE
jgi:hypothetical protein